MARRVKPLIMALFLLVSHNCYSANIIFDLGNVLVGVNKTNTVKKIGIYSLLLYLLRFNNPFSLRTRLFSVLDSIPSMTQNIYGAADETGKLLPGLCCDWLTGKQTCKEIKNQIAAFIENNPQEFHNYAEKNTIQKITNSMFTPEALAKSIYLLKDRIAFVKECKKQGHNVYVLSNWDRESFPFLLEKFPEFFSLFDDIIISGEIGLIKPDPLIYEYIIIKNSLDRNHCIFFDDQEVNIDAAKNSSNIHGVIVHKKMRHKDMTQALNLFLENTKQKESGEISNAIIMAG